MSRPINRDAHGTNRFQRIRVVAALVCSATFPAALLAHQAGNQYHYHVQPIALRYLLDDHVSYNATTNRYTESAAPVTKHSSHLGS